MIEATKTFSVCDVWPVEGGPRDGHQLLVPSAAPYVIALVGRLLPTREVTEFGGYYRRDHERQRWVYVERVPPATPEQQAYGRAAHNGTLTNPRWLRRD